MAAVGGLLMLVGSLASFVGTIMVLIKAFQKSIVWGLCSLFIPFVILAFVFLNWSEAQKGFLIALAGVVLGVLGAILSGTSGEPIALPQP